MIRVSILFVLASAAGCEKPNNVPTLHDEAVAIAQYYRPAVEMLNVRGEDIVKRGGKLGGAMAGGENASRAFSMAGQQLAELRALVLPGPDGKSQIEKQADAAAKDGKVAELEKLVGETSEKLEVGTRVITSELNLAEAWLVVAESRKLAMATPAPVVDPGSTPASTDGAPATGAAAHP
ncbi:MAG: hypothetical protein ABI591_15690 [Kofleriaceae bacterium]